MGALGWMTGADGDARAHWAAAADLKARFNRDWWLEEDELRGARDGPGQAPRSRGVIERGALPGRGHHRCERTCRRWLAGCSRPTCSAAGASVRSPSDHALYSPLSYHRGTVWAVEQATILFGLRRFGFDARAHDLARALFDLARLYPEYRIPECVGGYARGEQPTPGRVPTSQYAAALEREAFPLLVQTLPRPAAGRAVRRARGGPGAARWLPEIVITACASAARPPTCASGATPRLLAFEVVRKRGTLHWYASRRPNPARDVLERSARSSKPALRRMIHAGHSEDISRDQVMVITGASSGIGLVTARPPPGRARVSCSRPATKPISSRRSRYPARRGAAPSRRRRCRRSRQVEARRRRRARRVRAHRHLGEQRGRRRLRPIMELSHRGHAAPVRRELLGPGAWIARGGAASAADGRRAHQRRQRALRSRHSAAGQLLCGEACAQGLHRQSPDGARSGRAPISVTLIKPASIDTPLFDKARTHLDVEPQPVPPVYAPEIVADAILYCAQHPVRDVIVGGSGKLISVSSLAPRLTDTYMERRLAGAQRTRSPCDWASRQPL